MNVRPLIVNHTQKEWDVYDALVMLDYGWLPTDVIITHQNIASFEVNKTYYTELLGYTFLGKTPITAEGFPLRRYCGFLSDPLQLL